MCNVPLIHVDADEKLLSVRLHMSTNRSWVSSVIIVSNDYSGIVGLSMSNVHVLCSAAVLLLSLELCCVHSFIASARWPATIMAAVKLLSDNAPGHNYYMCVDGRTIPGY